MIRKPVLIVCMALPDINRHRIMHRHVDVHGFRIMVKIATEKLIKDGAGRARLHDNLQIGITCRQFIHDRGDLGNMTITVVTDRNVQTRARRPLPAALFSQS